MQPAVQLLNGRYRVLERIGQGGMGSVYKAEDRLTGRQVALKRVATQSDELQFSSAGGSNDQRLALAHEFQYLASLQHPNIVSVMDYGFDLQGRPFLTMDYLPEAQTIVDYGRGRSLEEQVRLLLEMMEALAYLHRRDVIHRDLKPGNVLVVAGQVKVLDLGLAISPDRFGQGRGQATGTAAYLAPEVLSGASASQASDLYAAGVIAYELIAGRHPFNVQNMNLLLLGALYQPPELASLAAPDELKEVLGRLLAKSPEKRYQDVVQAMADLSRSIGRPLPRETLPVRESYLQAARFVGRDKEMAVLVSALHEARLGRGSAWLVGGESGVGKSRLLFEIRTRALVSGMLVLYDQALERGGPTYQLWREVLRRLVLSAYPDEVEAAILSELVPDIERLLNREVPQIPPLSGEAGQQRLVATITSLFGRLQQPVALIFEDLQWASESLKILKSLAATADRLPLLVIGDFRDDEAPDLPARVPSAEVLRLQRLGQAEVAELSEAMLGEAGQQAEVIDLLLQETEGNAFFLVEVVRTLAEEAGRLSDIGRGPLPDQVLAGNMQEAVQRRLARVPEKDQPLLRLAAVAGRQIDVDLLATLAGNFWHYTGPKRDLTEWLTTCANAAVLEFQDGRWRFSHDKLREGLLADLSAEERPLLHRYVAQAIVTIHPDDCTQMIALAEHWYQAGDVEEQAKYAVPAVEQLIRASNFRLAAKMADRVLAHLDDQQATVVTKLSEMAGTANARLGRFEQAFGFLERGRLVAEESGDQATLLIILNTMSRACAGVGDYKAAQTWASKSLQIAEIVGDRLGMAQSLRNMAKVASIRGDFVRAQDYDLRSLALVQEAGDQGGIAAALNSIGVGATFSGQYEEARQYFERSRAIYEALGSQYNSGIITMNLGAIAVRQGAFAQAEEFYRRSLDISQAIGNQVIVALNQNNLGVMAAKQGRYMEGERLFRRGLAISKRIGDQFGLAYGLRGLADVRLRQRQASAAYPYLRRALEVADEIGAVTMALEIITACAQYCLLSGDPEMSGRWLGFVLSQPALDDGIRADLAAELYSQLEMQLGVAGLESSMTSGRGLTLQQVVAEVLSLVEAESKPVHVAP